MKTLGTTTDGKYIVEMLQEEYYEFINLESSVNGSGIYFGDYMRRGFRGTDLSPVFRALNELATAKQSISSLQSYINNLASYFGKVQIPEAKDEDA